MEQPFPPFFFDAEPHLSISLAKVLGVGISFPLPSGMQKIIKLSIVKFTTGGPRAIKKKTEKTPPWRKARGRA
jgi:hypothetical protein